MMQNSVLMIMGVFNADKSARYGLYRVWGEVNLPYYVKGIVYRVMESWLLFLYHLQLLHLLK